MKVLVTGATGFLGSNLTRLLLKRGYRVRALVRPTSHLDNIRDLDVELAYGDVRDKDSVEKACQDCGCLYHVAAAYHFWLPNPQEFYDINVQGTQNVLEAARDKGIERVVYTSTVGVLRYPDSPEFPSDEKNLPSDGDLHNHYKRSKYMAEQIALRFASEGVPIVIVNPSAPIGSYDIKPTPTGRMIVDFLKGEVPVYINTGLNVVDVVDVAWGHLLAAEKGRIGERYILGNQNMSLKEIYQLIARLGNKIPPRFCLPYTAALTIAYGSEMVANVLKTKPRVPVGAVKMAKKYMYFSARKAIEELGLPQSPVENAFERAVCWFQNNGYL